jgi:hypothetical protein
MKTKMKFLLLVPFFAILLLTSCQEEVVEVSNPTENEALVATSELTSMVSATAKMDGSVDNIIDKASCLSIKLPLKVVVNGIEIIVDSKDDYKIIEAIFNKYDGDKDLLDIVFPIKIISSDHSEIDINSRLDFENLVKKCQGENEVDDDIECIDFQYPISFSVYNTNFQVANVVKIENDRELHYFMNRVKNAEVKAKLNFPVTMELADGSEIVVNNHSELENTLRKAKNACNEDDNNDFHDDDFTKERLDNLLKICPWVVYEFQKNSTSLDNTYSEYVLTFLADNVVKMRKKSGDILTGKWTTRSTIKGTLIKLEFETVVDFNLEWFVYELEPGRIKLYQEGGNKIILKKNCDLVVDISKERIENYLQECYWRIARLNINGTDNDKDYIGTPFKFLSNNVVKIRANGELIAGTYEVGVRNNGFILKITLDGRPDLKLEWLITYLQPGLIKLENANNKMVLERHCFDTDNDLNYVENVVVAGSWLVAKYDDGLVHIQDPTKNFAMYTINFLESGAIKVTDPNNGISAGSWLAYRNDGLFLGLQFANKAPFNELNFRWRIKSISANRIELKELSSTGAIVRILVLEKKI